MKKFLIILFIFFIPLTTNAMNKEKHPHKYRLEQKKKAQKAARKGSQNESAFLNQVQALRNKSGQNPWTEAASQK